MEYIHRKSLLYKSGVEYAGYTVNHVLGCSHACAYPCYAYLLARRFGKVKSFEEWCNPKLVYNAASLLEDELSNVKEKVESIHLCFTTDPFMYGFGEISEMSIKLIDIINARGIAVTALSKGVLPAVLSTKSRSNEYGITLVSLDDDFQKRFEPGAAPINDRITALRILKEDGCKTWASIEPYPTPNIYDQDFTLILERMSFVDKIIFGRLNYNKLVTEYRDYKEFFNRLATQVIGFCNDHGIAYHIKEGTISEPKSPVGKQNQVSSVM